MIRTPASSNLSNGHPQLVTLLFLGTTAASPSKEETRRNKIIAVEESILDAIFQRWTVAATDRTM